MQVEAGFGKRVSVQAGCVIQEVGAVGAGRVIAGGQGEALRGSVSLCDVSGLVEHPHGIVGARRLGEDEEESAGHVGVVVEE